jgi:diguanylate cyclase (GGDEF)-like protein/PAS domain S-box-containing protein
MSDEKFVDPKGGQDESLISKLLYQFIDEKYRPLLDESSDLMCITDREGRFIYINKKLGDSLGYTKKEMLGMHMNDIVAPESKDEFKECAKDFLKIGKVTLVNFALKTKYDGRVLGEMSSMAFYDNYGKYCGAKAVFRDRTQLLEMESLEKKYESMLEDGIGSMDSVIIILNKDLKVKWASGNIQKYFGLDKSVVVAEDVRELFKNKMGAFFLKRDEFLENVLSAYEMRVPIMGFECEISSPESGEKYILEHVSYPVSTGDLSGGRIEIFRDITVKKKFEETLEYYYKKIHAIMEHAVEGILELRTDNTIEFINRSFLAMVGHTEMELLNHNITDFIAFNEREKLVAVKLIRKAREITFIKKDGSPLYALMSSIPLVFGSQPPHALCFISDVTETRITTDKLREANLTLRSLNDSLLDLSLRDVRTGVYNARYLSERLSEEIKRAKRYFRPFSLIMIDIDFFKSVNDTYGHNFGDFVLRGFSDLLKKTVRETDIIIRSGGEEFVVFLSDTDSSGALTVAQKIIKAVERVSFGDGHQSINITISMGIASYPEVGISDASGLFEAADAAMYQSKATGRDKITVFKGTFKEEKDAPGKGKEVSFDYLRERLKNINLRNEESVLEAMRPMVKEADRRLGYPPEHRERVLEWVEKLAKNFLASEKEIKQIKRAALLCNIGFLALPEDILLKKGPLTKSQKKLIQGHPFKSLEMIQDFAFLGPERKDILSVHERYDGKGYPKGLKAENIPLGSRIISVAESYEALTTPRPYRPQAFSRNESLKILKKDARRQFDPRVVSSFLSSSL